MRLDSARTELNEKGKSCKNSGQAYGKDKEAWDATQKEIKRIEVIFFMQIFLRNAAMGNLIALRKRYRNAGHMTFDQSIPVLYAQCALSSVQSTQSAVSWRSRALLPCLRKMHENDE